ncbi:MAG TPA: hypothetical protein VN285_06710 [Candidatus Deferrimicrobium sp.]|nr:hypothetical protein [Candidatus Deferrimicrobium sp.]
MQRSQTLLGLSLVAIALLVWAGLGCDGEKSPPGPTLDCDQAAVLVDSANDSLGRQMDRVVNVILYDPDSSFRPDEIDFAGVNQLYEEALSLCPTDRDAAFGASFTGLMLFLADPTLNDLIDRFKYVYDTAYSGANPVGKLLPLVNLDGYLVPRGIPLQAGGFHKVLPSLPKLDHAIVTLAAADPTIGEVQDVLEQKLLPRVVSARTRMQLVLTAPEFTFTITPEMQGDEGASPIFLDRSDFRVILATLYAAEAALHVFVARDLDVMPYDITGIEAALDQNSSFLSLKSGGVGAGHMSTAKTRILSAEVELENALDDLMDEAESGADQTYDLIKVYPEDWADLDKIKDSLAYYRTYFDGPKQLRIVWTNLENCYWDYYYGWVCDTINDSVVMMVDVRKFFDAPLNNPKLFLPTYTLTLDELSPAYKNFAGYYFSRTKYWNMMYAYFGISHPNDTPTFAYHLPDEDNDEFYRLLAEYPSTEQFIWGWNDATLKYDGCPEYYLSCWYSPLRDQYEPMWWQRHDVEACYVWEADTYADWTWPYPTFNGLLPEMTSDELKELLFEFPEDWRKSGCDTLEF